MSVFLETNHLMARKPSDAGDPQAMINAGFGALFCNVGDYPASDWIPLRDRAWNVGMKCGPWLRTADAHTVFDPRRLSDLIDIADAWNWAPLICNSEKEIDNTYDDLTGYIAEELGDRDAAISVEVRPFGNVDWKPLGGYPILPQKFPAETGNYDSDSTIRMNWYAAGATCVVITYGSYGGMRPVDFERLDPYGVYTADDCGNNFAAWGSLGKCAPCRDNGQDGGGDETVAEPLPPGAFDDCAKYETTAMKRPDGKDATAFTDRAKSLKATRDRVLELEDRILRLEGK